MDVSDPVKPSFRLPEELLASPALLLARLGFSCKARWLEELEPLDCSPYSYGVLALLGEGARTTQGAIADALRLDRGQLVGVLDELEDRGFVTRRRDPGDRRRHLVDLTAEGRTQLLKLRQLVRRVDDELLAPLDEDSRATLHALLRRLVDRDPAADCAPPV